MKIKTVTTGHTFWYIVYIISNVCMLGAPWFLRGLITHSIKQALQDDEGGK